LFAETKSYTKRAALILSFLIPNSGLGFFEFVHNAKKTWQSLVKLAVRTDQELEQLSITYKQLYC